MPSRGGGHKRKYRIIDFKRRKFDVEATVVGIEYDLIERTASLLKYADGKKHILPVGLTAGDTVVAGETWLLSQVMQLR